MDFTEIALLNISIAFFIGAVYSFLELLNYFKTVRKFYKNTWGYVYVLLNGALASLALLLTFRDDINSQFLGAKILVAGTSALALLRIIIVPIKHGETSNAVMPMIDVVFNYVKVAYDRQRSKDDLIEIKGIMKDVDYRKAAENLPVLCSNLLRTLSEADGQRLNEEIQKILAIEEGVRQIKAINLGVVLAKYIGNELLSSTVSQTKEFLKLDTTGANSNERYEEKEIDKLIEKFS